MVAFKKSDALTKFDFDIVPHDFYSTCFFCDINPTNKRPGADVLPLRKDIAKPGQRKRNMPVPPTSGLVPTEIIHVPINLAAKPLHQGHGTLAPADAQGLTEDQ